MMEVDFVTKRDLQEFRAQLLKDIRDLIKPTNVRLKKPWLKNSEVRTLLNIFLVHFSVSA